MKHILLILFSGVVLSLNAQQKDSPKLIVGIVVDQMSYDYLYRYYDKFGDDGFKLMMNEGTNSRNMHYNYAPTFTGPGHASIYTGSTPSNHGIIANEWYFRDLGEVLNCVYDSKVTTVGSTSDNGTFSPFNLKANTITDQLKLTYPNSKVISLSIKNRGAILPGGHLSDGSYWFDYKSGTFITSSFFKEKLPDWVVKFNDLDYPNKSLKKTWETLYPIEKYTESGPDNSPYEKLMGTSTKPVFPYDLGKIAPEDDPYSVFTSSPYANTYLVDFAKTAIKAEGLGTDNQTDMLCLSFSTTDIVGHAFGPYAVETEDIYLRLDLEIAKLIKHLKNTVGKNEFTIFLTADHGVIPVPQYMIDHKLPGGYLFCLDEYLQLIEDVKERFDLKNDSEGKSENLMSTINNMNIYIDHSKVKEKGLDLNEVSSFIATKVQEWDHVKATYTANHIYKASSDDEWKDLIRRGLYDKKSGDVVIVMEPGYVLRVRDTEEERRGTEHGSVFNYDTQVPLLWYGKNIPKQEIHRNLNITDISATLTQMLYVQSPNALTGKPILEVLEKK
jgi:predicted AlkP superfamily pyrophosphatase or phosphodiesterase